MQDDAHDKAVNTLLRNGFRPLYAPRSRTIVGLSKPINRRIGLGLWKLIDYLGLPIEGGEDDKHAKRQTTQSRSSTGKIVV